MIPSPSINRSIQHISNGSILKAGDMILEVNRKPVENTDEFRKAMAGIPDKNAVLLLVKEGEYARYVALKTD